MRDLPIPFKFDLSSVVSRARRLPKAVDGISINLPFVSVSVKPDNTERRVAREIVIRMADRRVLNAFECCDDCIDRALASLQEIRRFIVDKQVDLADHADGALYLLLEAMAEGIRQFSTFEQRLSRRPEDREKYFAALEMLRAHLHRVLLQVSVLGDVKIPKIADQMRYSEAWQLEAYRTPSLPGSDLGA
jgi:hypothetical protein